MPKSARPVATFDHLSKKKPLRKIVTVYTDDEAVDAHNAAVEALEDGRSKATAQKLSPLQVQELLAPLKAEVEATQAELEKASINCVFESIGRKRYDALIAACPPSEKDHELAVEQQGEGSKALYNSDAFSVALISASCVEPVMTHDEVIELREAWNANEYVELFVAALTVNTQRRVAAVGKGSG